MKPHVLIIEDDASLLEILSFNLQEHGFQVTQASTGAQGLAAYEPTRHEVVLTDLKLPDMDGLEVLSALKAQDAQVVVVILTAFGSTTRAVNAMRQGAFHYIEKPVNTRALVGLLERARDHRKRLHPSPGREDDAAYEPLIVAASPHMSAVLRVVDKIAPSDVPVLIRGESGTGKELVARTIHARSARRQGPLIAVNCAAIPADLLESVLFGHERGAFTGATSGHRGKFLAADGGTIFLDEIAELAAPLQSKLLRVLQNGEVDVIGQAKPARVDVRVISATHQDMEACVARQAFRQDLLYRLNVIPLQIAPLRERPEDIPVLLRHLVRRLEPTQANLPIDRAVDDALLAHTWPGNVRELENVVKRMLLLRDGPGLSAQDIPPELRPQAQAQAQAPPQGLPFALPEDGLDLVALERRIIEAALRKHEGNQSATARYLNIPRHVLLYRMEKYGITPDDPHTEL